LIIPLSKENVTLILINQGTYWLQNILE